MPKMKRRNEWWEDHARLRERIAELKAALRELPPGNAGSDSHRLERRKLGAKLRRTERRLFNLQQGKFAWPPPSQRVLTK